MDNRHKIPDELLESINVDFATGEIRWARTLNSKAVEGQIAGCLSQHGYRTIGYQYRQYFGHRLVWAKRYGAESMPLHLDHIDGNPQNNALSNLRPATQGQNNINTAARRAYGKKPCASRLKGVTQYRKGDWVRWRARIRLGGKEHSLGYFDTEEDAAAAYKAAARRFYGEFAGT